MDPIMYTQARFLVPGDVIAHEGTSCGILKAVHDVDSCIRLDLYDLAEKRPHEPSHARLPDYATVRVLRPYIVTPERTT